MSRELDAEVAEKVMELSLTPLGGFQVSGDRTPAYSTDIAAAWMVVNEMRKRKYIFKLQEHYYTNEFMAAFKLPVVDGEDLEFCGYDKSEALAICKAAIEAMGGK